jgi:hypothetical protein
MVSFYGGHAQARCGPLRVLSRKIFYVVNQINRVLFLRLKNRVILYQEVEEETVSAGEQPASNRLPALHCDNTGGRIFSCPLFIDTGIALWLKKTHPVGILSPV